MQFITGGFALTFILGVGAYLLVQMLSLGPIGWVFAVGAVLYFVGRV